MAAFTRVNGLDCEVGVLYGINAKLVFVVVKDTTDTAVDIRNEDDVVDEVMEQIIKEANPLAFMAEDSADGKITMVVDLSISAADLQHRIRLIGSTTGWNRSINTYSVTEIGPNDVDISGTTVSEGAGYQISFTAPP